MPSSEFKAFLSISGRRGDKEEKSPRGCPVASKPEVEPGCLRGRGVQLIQLQKWKEEGGERERENNLLCIRLHANARHCGGGRGRPRRGCHTAGVLPQRSWGVQALSSPSKSKPSLEQRRGPLPASPRSSEAGRGLGGRPADGSLGVNGAELLRPSARPPEASYPDVFLPRGPPRSQHSATAAAARRLQLSTCA